MGESAVGTEAPATSERLLSVDALRGADMFVIMGGERLFQRLAVFLPPAVGAVLDQQLEHADWEGFRFYDLIFPLFLFLVGVVIPFSLGKMRQRGASRSELYGRLARRTLLLFALGLLYNGILKFDWSNLRVAGVLQRIAICYGAASVFYLNSNRRGRVLSLVAILLGYWALFALVAPPDSHPGDYAKETNLGGYIDRHYLPGKIMSQWYGHGDNEGLLSTIPAIATTLLGVLAGEWLRSARRSGSKVLGLLLAGAVLTGLGLAWGHSFPIIKNLWTSSFVCLAGGLSLLLLGLFHFVIDVQGWRRWAFPFVVIGANAIAIFILPQFVDFHYMQSFFLQGVETRAEVYADLLKTAGFLTCEWLFLLFLYHHKIFLRV